MCFSRCPTSHLQRSLSRKSRNCSPLEQAAEMGTSLVLLDRDTKIPYSMEKLMRQLKAISPQISDEAGKAGSRHHFRHQKCGSTVAKDDVGCHWRGCERVSLLSVNLMVN